jgi:hypothetical protein
MDRLLIYAQLLFIHDGCMMVTIYIRMYLSARIGCGLCLLFIHLIGVFLDDSFLH